VSERIVFFGRNKNYDITLLCFLELVKFLQDKEHEVIIAVVSDDNHEENGTLEQSAKSASIPWTSIKDNDVNNSVFINRLAGLEPTIFIAVQFPKIFKPELLKIPRRGSFNIHRGWPLRGGSIDERAVYYNLSDYNVILHHMTPGIDTGNIIGKVGFKLSDKDNGYTLSKKADEAGKKVMVDHFLPIIGDTIPYGEKQDIGITIYDKKGSLSNVISFKETSENIERLCRAFYHPRKLGAFFNVREKEIYVIPPVKIIKVKEKKEIGTILYLRESLVNLVTGNSGISIEKCHLGDKKAIDFGRFLLKHNFKTGDVLLN